MINIREIPFVRWLLPFLLGILLSIFLNLEIPSLHYFVFGLLLLSIIAYFQKGWFKYGWLLTFPQYLFFTGFGYQITWLQNDLNDPIHFQNHLEARNLIIGNVQGIPIKKKWVQVELMMQRIGPHSDSLMPCKGTILVYLERDSLSENLNDGDLVGLYASINEIAPPKNPHAFDYKRYLHFQNIHYQTFAKNGDWMLLEKREAVEVFSLALNLRTHFLETLRKYLPEKNEFSVGSALILGYKDEISEEVQTAYANTGAMHVLAVSGLHVGIIYLLLQFFLLKRIYSFHPFWKAAKIVIPILGIWAFALITGMPPSVRRAATMFSIFIIGTAFQRNKNPYNILAASAFWLLCFNPYLITQVSFQLSYCAVVGIIYFQPKFAQLWTIKSKIGNYLWQLGCVSLAAQLATLPLGFYYFHQFPVYFWLSGLIVVPAAFVILLMGILLFVVELIFPGGGTTTGYLLLYFIKGVNWLVFFIQNLPGSVIAGIWISSVSAFLMYLFLVNVSIAINVKKFKWVLSSLGILAFVSVNYSFSKLEDRKNRKLVIYHIYKNSTIDFFDGTDLYTISNTAIGHKELAFAVQNNRWKEGVKKNQKFHFEDTNHFESSRFLYKDGFIQFYNKRLAVLSESPDFQNTDKLKVDYLLLRNNPKLYIDQVLEHFEFDLLLFDASNANWRVEKWKEFCRKAGIANYDINEEGAWILEMN